MIKTKVAVSTKMRSTKKRKPKLTRIEKMTQGLMLSREDVISKFSVREVADKGRAIFLATKIIRKDSFVLEYEGDVITHDEAVLREEVYAVNDEGCFILFFRFQGRKLAIDATRKFGSYARYLNHSRDPNIRFHPPLLVDFTVHAVPRIAAYALRDIREGEEIVFDYGVRDGSISWLLNKKRCHESELTDSSSEEQTDSSDGDGPRSTRDQIMSVTRTPTQNLSLKPSKYLTPVRTPTSSSSHPPSFAKPREGYGIRYIAYSSGPTMKRTYIASMEGLGQPLKIMRSVEEMTSPGKERGDKGFKCSESIISLSESDDFSVKTPPNSTPSVFPTSSRDSCLPVDAVPSSASKVLEWQQKIALSPAKQETEESDIKILHVRSLHEEKKISTPPSSSSSLVLCSTSNDCSYQSVRKSNSTNVSCISDIINGSAVPEAFVPNIKQTISDGSYDRERLPVHNIPHYSAEPTPSQSPKQPPMKFHPNIERTYPTVPQHQVHESLERSYVGADTRSCNLNNGSPPRDHHSGVEYPSQTCFNTLAKHVDDSEIMICVSDSEDVIVDDDHSQKTGLVRNEHSEDLPQSKVQTEQRKCQNQGEDKNEGLVISSVESLNPGIHNAYQTQTSEIHTVYQNAGREVHTVYQNHRNHTPTPSRADQNAGREVHTVYQNQRNHTPTPSRADQNAGREVHTVYQNHRNHTPTPSRADKIQGGHCVKAQNIQYEYQDKSGGTVRYEYQEQNQTVVKPDKETKPNDFVEILDEGDSDFEIISDGELPSTSISQRKPLETRVNPSCSKFSSVPVDTDVGHHRSNPHIAVVKPYSQENDQDIVLQEDKAAEDDVIEVLEDDDDGVVITQGIPSFKGGRFRSELSQDEIRTMKNIFQPLILSSDSLSSSCVERAISENFNFFSVLIGRGVPVNEIRRTVWKLFKMSKKETPIHV